MIDFFSESIRFQLSSESNSTSWIEQIISSENKQLGDLSFIFCSDEYLHKINMEYLNHDTYTDIITFNYCEGEFISGDIFISIERVEENASKFNIDFDTELSRVLAHGVLHLIGYNDKTDEETLIMRAKEDFYLSLRNN